MTRQPTTKSRLPVNAYEECFYPIEDRRQRAAITPSASVGTTQINDTPNPPIRQSLQLPCNHADRIRRLRGQLSAARVPLKRKRILAASDCGHHHFKFVFA